MAHFLSVHLAQDIALVNSEKNAFKGGRSWQFLPHYFEFADRIPEKIKGLGRWHTHC
jgi:hypothetical protein